MIELLRLVIPESKIVNNNHGQHYRVLQGKQKWIGNQSLLQIEGFEGPGGFKTPSIEESNLITQNGKKFDLILEVWKCQRSFDPHNYNATAKYMIDALTSSGYFEDDSWKYVNSLTIVGGDYSVWKERPFRYINDGLPESIARKWWDDNGYDPIKDTLIRLIAKKVKRR